MQQSPVQRNSTQHFYVLLRARNRDCNKCYMLIRYGRRLDQGRAEKAACSEVGAALVPELAHLGMGGPEDEVAIETCCVLLTSNDSIRLNRCPLRCGSIHALAQTVAASVPARSRT